MESGKKNGKKIGRESGEREKEKRGKRVTCLDTGVTYISIKEASRQTKTHPNRIRESANTGGELVRNGRRWVYFKTGDL